VIFRLEASKRMTVRGERTEILDPLREADNFILLAEVRGQVAGDHAKHLSKYTTE
jgi:hypothetical protein